MIRSVPTSPHRLPNSRSCVSVCFSRRFLASPAAANASHAWKNAIGAYCWEFPTLDFFSFFHSPLFSHRNMCKSRGPRYIFTEYTFFLQIMMKFLAYVSPVLGESTDKHFTAIPCCPMFHANEVLPHVHLTSCIPRLRGFLEPSDTRP